MKRTDITNLFPDATDEQINALMSIHGNDVNTAKKGFDELQKTLQATQEALAAAKAESKVDELQKTLDKMGKLQTELDGMKASEALRLIREKVAKATGVPAGLLTGEDEGSCTQQAQAIMTFAKSAGYPPVRDGGEVGKTSTKTTAEQFAEWSEQIF